MSKLAVLLQDLPADSVRFGAKLLPKEQWDDIFAARARGVSMKSIFAACTGKVEPFYPNPKSFQSAYSQERTRRAKAAQLKTSRK